MTGVGSAAPRPSPPGCSPWTRRTSASPRVRLADGSAQQRGALPSRCGAPPGSADPTSDPHLGCPHAAWPATAANRRRGGNPTAAAPHAVARLAGTVTADLPRRPPGSPPYGDAQGDVAVVPRALVVDYAVFERTILPGSGDKAAGQQLGAQPETTDLPPASWRRTSAVDHAPTLPTPPRRRSTPTRLRHVSAAGRGRRHRGRQRRRGRHVAAKQMPPMPRSSSSCSVSPGALVGPALGLAAAVRAGRARAPRAGPARAARGHQLGS